MKKTTHYKREILIAEVEKEIVKYTALKDIIGVLTTAVGTFNCEKSRKSQDWREHLKSYMTSEYSLNWDSFEHGFSGDHFWLHDGLGTKSTRVILIYSIKVASVEI